MYRRSAEMTGFNPCLIHTEGREKKENKHETYRNRGDSRGGALCRG